MPPEQKVEASGGTQQGSVGMFDGLPGAAEATRDAETVETENPESTSPDSTAQDTTQTQQETTEVEPTEEEETQELDENGQPIDKKQPDVKQESFEINGRTFASKDELITAYKHSSNEGLRLAKQHDEDQHRINELNARLLELEDAQAMAPFPELLSADKAQEEAQLEMLPQHKQTEYILKKREWEQKQQGIKEANAQKRKQLEATKAQIKDIIAKNDAEMASKADEFPMYKELKTTMSKIVELSPVLANRPETPYLSYWIAYGLNAYNKEVAQKAEAKKAVTVTKDKAAAAQTQIGKGGIGKTGTKTGPTGSSIANAWKERNGSVI